MRLAYHRARLLARRRHSSTWLRATSASLLSPSTRISSLPRSLSPFAGQVWHRRLPYVCRTLAPPCAPPGSLLRPSFSTPPVRYAVVGSGLLTFARRLGSRSDDRRATHPLYGVPLWPYHLLLHVAGSSSVASSATSRGLPLPPPATRGCAAAASSRIRLVDEHADGRRHLPRLPLRPLPSLCGPRAGPARWTGRASRADSARKMAQQAMPRS